MRLFDEEHHREAICADQLVQFAALSPLRSGSSRPALLSGVVRQVQHAGQRCVKVSILHEKGDIIARAITLISNLLHRIRTITARWAPEQSWAVIWTRILRHKPGGKWLGDLPPEAGMLLSG